MKMKGNGSRVMKHTLLAIGMLAAGVRGNEIKHCFVASDYMNGALHYVDQNDVSKNWTIKLPEAAFDLQLLDKNSMLCNRSKGFEVYDLTLRQKVDGFLSDALKDIRTVQRRTDGHTFLGCQAGTVYEISAQKRLLATYEMPKSIKYVRLMRFTPKGTLVLAADDGAYEVSLDKGLDAEKRLLRKFALPRPRNAYMAQYAPDGNLRLSGGYSKGFYVFNPQGILLKDLVFAQPEGLNNFFYAGFQILKNGHVVMANWTGHNAKDFKPGWKLIEFDQNDSVVWTWNEPYGGTVNQVIVLDE